MIFEKPSTRTRVSFETGMTRLGGHAMFLGPDDIQLGHGEPLRDTARVLGRYVDGVMMDSSITKTSRSSPSTPTARSSTGLTDEARPCQTLADLLTIRETVGRGRHGRVGRRRQQRRAVVRRRRGDDRDRRTGPPPEYGMDPHVFDRAGVRRRRGADDPEAAIDGADVVYTDVWISMGQEDPRGEARRIRGVQVNADLLAGTDAKVMHCLPAHRGEEITDGVLESDRALVWDQAENRMHAQNALLVELLGGE